MAPLTVVHVAGSAQWAGGETFLKQMAERLDRSRVSLRVICPEEGPLQQEMHRRDVPCEIIPLVPLGNPFPVRKLADLINQWNADVVQSHGARSNFYTRFAAGPIPNISTVHNALSDYPVNTLKKNLYIRMDAWTAPKANVLACVADSLRDELIQRIPSISGKTRVMYNGVDLDIFNPQKIDRLKVRQELGLNSQFTIGLIGRMTEQKGHFYLLDALRSVKKFLPAIRVLMVGDGPLRSAIEEKARHCGLADECVFLGVRSDIPELLSAMDLVVMPSLSEGFPYALLETLAMQRPVVASDVNGVKEILDGGRCGVMVPPRDIHSLGQAILNVIQHSKDAKDRALVGRNRVLKNFNLAMTLRRWEALYEELAARRRND